MMSRPRSDKNYCTYKKTKKYKKSTCNIKTNELYYKGCDMIALKREVATKI